MIITTNRLVLRPFAPTDDSAVYALASNPNVALSTGFAPHDSIDTSRASLKNILINDYTWAVTLDNQLIGCISLNYLGKEDNKRYEIGYWLGQPYWGNGYIPEATSVLVHYAINTLGIDTVWCAYEQNNHKSHTVQDKCHFVYHHTVQEHNHVLEKDVIMHYTCVSARQLIGTPAPLYTITQ